MVKKGIAVLFYVFVIFFIIAYKATIMTWLTVGGLENFPIVMGAAILLAMVPFIPYGIAAGFIGAAYGPLWGSLITVAASTIAAAVTFGAIRLFFKERARAYIVSSERLVKYVVMLEQNSFMAVAVARMIPFVPAFAVTASAAMIRMSWGSFILATAIGKIPVLVLFVVMGGQLMSGI